MVMMLHPALPRLLVYSCRPHQERHSDQMSNVDDPLSHHIRGCLLELLDVPGKEPTVGLSEAAKTLSARIGYPWHDLMRPIRTVAAAMVDAGAIEATQHEQVVDIRAVRGPVRLRRRNLAR